MISSYQIIKVSRPLRNDNNHQGNLRGHGINLITKRKIREIRFFFVTRNRYGINNTFLSKSENNFLMYETIASLNQENKQQSVSVEVRPVWNKRSTRARGPPSLRQPERCNQTH